MTLAFGQQVTVTRQVVRVLVDQREVYEDITNADQMAKFTMQRSKGYVPLYRAVLGARKAARYDHPSHSGLYGAGDGWAEWPGVGISEKEAPLPRWRFHGEDTRKSYDVEPSSVLSVRFRRVDLPETLDGVAIGHVVLQEGRICEGSGGGPYDDPEPPYFAQERRVPLEEVAITTEARARIMLCWSGDLQQWCEPA